MELLYRHAKKHNKMRSLMQGSTLLIRKDAAESGLYQVVRLIALFWML